MNLQFPKTKIGNVELPRMIIGTNWILGYSHKSWASSVHIKEINNSTQAVAAQFEIYLKYGVNAVIGPMVGPLVSTGGDGLQAGGQANVIVDAAKIASEKWNTEMILIPTTDLNTEDSETARKEAKRAIDAAAAIGAKICYISFTSIDRLLDFEKKQIRRLDDYTYMVREAGMVPMIGNHNYQVIAIADANGYDVEAYLTPYNSAGFYLQAEVEEVYRTIHNAKKPVMTIKAMAAGRLTPFVGLTFNYNTIREKDMVAVGALTAHEVQEDIEISLAAIERKPAKRLVGG